MSYKPDGYNSASPYLVVRDANATLGFLEAAFGATRLRVIPGEGGKGIMHAEALVDDTVIMMGEMPESTEAHVHVYVAEAEAAFARALTAGGTEVQPLTDKGDGDLRGGVRDANGVTWWISRQLD